jgi:predicted O-methyltransferase YrrM
MSLKQALRSYLLQSHPSWLAAYDYHLKPSLKASWGGPFNGQEGRQAIFRELVSKIQFQMIVETGTYRGTTTEFLAQESGLLVCTVETEPRFYHYARRRLKGQKQIRLELGDSREFITKLARDAALPKQSVFFYLDAHWQEDLPLKQEIEIIVKYWRGICIMIDDFQVPGDEGYTYDDYGPEKRLCLDYLQPLPQFGLTAFFPSLPSSRETGGKRGCVLLADENFAVRLRDFQTLRII